MITEKDLKYLKVAESVSLTSDYERVHIGACVVKKGNIIGVGCNSNKSHPVQKKYNELVPYDRPRHGIHAEIKALLKCNVNTNNSTIYVFRRGRDSNIRNCSPCESCRAYMIECGVKRIVYVAENGVFEESLR